MSEDDKKPKKVKLRTREKLFVKEIVHNPGQTGAGAIYNAGYKPKDATNAKNMAAVMIHKPKIQEAIRVEIERLYPNALADNFAFLVKIRDSPEARDGDRIAAAKEINKMAGYQSPTQHQRLNATVQLPKLPKE